MRANADTNATARVLLSILRREGDANSTLNYAARAFRAAAHRYAHSGDVKQQPEAELYALAIELVDQIKKAGG